MHLFKRLFSWMKRAMDRSIAKWQVRFHLRQCHAIFTFDTVMRFQLEILPRGLSRHSTKIGGYVDSSVTRLGYLLKVKQKLPKLWATFCAILKNVFSDKSGNFLTKFLTNPRQHFEDETQNIFLCNTFQLFVSVFVLI